MLKVDNLRVDQTNKNRITRLQRKVVDIGLPKPSIGQDSIKARMCSVRLCCENLIPPSGKNFHIIPLIPFLIFSNLHILDTGGGHGRDCLLQLRGSVRSQRAS